jgi:hypothetical protein
VPIETVGESGERVASWEDKFPISWVDLARAEAEADGQLETFAQEYLCQAAAPHSHAFREEHFRFEDRQHTWEPAFVLYDPARTVGSKSDATGKVVASVIGGKILVWEASGHHWQPSELIDDIFATNEKYHPIAIGVEVTGLNQFIEQPLRQAQLMRGSLPLRPMNPPRGPGKEGFLLRLQPFFSAGEVSFCGPRQKFEPLIKELLGFPYLNALAYILEIKPGEPNQANFTNSHVIDVMPPSVISHGQKHLLLDSDGRTTVAILIALQQERTFVLADWCESSAPGLVIPNLVRTARAAGMGPVAAYAKPEQALRRHRTRRRRKGRRAASDEGRGYRHRPREAEGNDADHAGNRALLPSLPPCRVDPSRTLRRICQGAGQDRGDHRALSPDWRGAGELRGKRRGRPRER